MTEANPSDPNIHNPREYVEDIQYHIDEIIHTIYPMNGGIRVKITVEYGDYNKQKSTELQYEGERDWYDNPVGNLTSVKIKSKCPSQK